MLSFQDHILSWSFQDLASYQDRKKPCLVDKANFIKKQYNSIDTYLENFLPSLLEDAKTVIGGGLEKENANLSLNLVENVKKGNNPNRTLIFGGTLKTEVIDSGPILNILKLEKHGMCLLAIARDLPTENPADNVVTCVCEISSVDFTDCCDTHFVAGAEWSITYLGNLVSHARIFNACKSLTSSVLLENIFRSNRATFDSSPSQFLNFSTQRGRLNNAQLCAVQRFHCMHEHNIMTLQGPPGTGKTSTVTVLLEELYQQDQRTLVCAPSNKAVQVLAKRYLDDHPNARIVISAVAEKVPASLSSISLKTLLESIQAHAKEATKTAKSINTMLPIKNSKTKPLRKDLKVLEEHLATIYNSIERYNTFLNSIVQKLVRDSGDITRLTLVPTDSTKILSFLIEITHVLGMLMTKENEEALSIEILNDCLIVFSTLSNSGGGTMLRMDPVTNLIVDEAGQSIEAETVIALQHLPTKVSE